MPPVGAALVAGQAAFLVVASAGYSYTKDLFPTTPS